MDQIWLKIEVKLKKLEVWRWIEGKTKNFKTKDQVERDTLRGWNRLKSGVKLKILKIWRIIEDEIEIFKTNDQIEKKTLDS
jgi:hypothetical protein